ncbi:MAG TPA: Ig-like domain-containing protein [Isosphaeraceae bacterium]
MDDSASTSMEEPVAIDVLADDFGGTRHYGDHDPDGDAIDLDRVEDGTDGTTTLVRPASGAPPFVVYTPDAGFFGSDRFRYTIRDVAGLTATALVSVSVSPWGKTPLEWTGPRRFLINDDFDQHLTDPGRPGYELSDLNPDPQTRRYRVDPNDDDLVSAKLTIGPAGMTGTLYWGEGVAGDKTQAFRKDERGEWVPIRWGTNFHVTAPAQPIDVLVSGIRPGRESLYARFVPDRAPDGEESRVEVTVSSGLRIDGTQAGQLLQQLATVTRYDLMRDTATGDVWKTGGWGLPPTDWRTRVRVYFGGVQDNRDQSRQGGVTSIKTGNLVHALWEQYQKQIRGIPDWPTAHAAALMAESDVLGGTTRTYVGPIGGDFHVHDWILPSGGRIILRYRRLGSQVLDVTVTRP